jgi:hypothetical protein
VISGLVLFGPDDEIGNLSPLLSLDEFIFEGLKNHTSTICMSADWFSQYLAAFLW